MSAWSTTFENGLLDDFNFTVGTSTFTTDARYNNGDTTLLVWEGKTDDPDQPEHRLQFPLGKGWSSQDGGITISHDSGKTGKYFVKGSMISRLVERCVNDFGIGDLLEKRGDPFHSSVWEGLTFHVKYETIDYGPGIESKPKLMPNQFIGEATPAAATSNGSGGGAAALAKARAKKAAPTTSLRDQALEAMRAHAGDFGSAQEAAFQVPGVAEDEKLVDELLAEDGLFSEV